MRLFYYLYITLILISCSNNVELIFDQDNGGLLLPDGFRSLVVHEGVGQSRHIAVNQNGDIYVKLRKDFGRDGNVALRDKNGDGKAEIIKRFGDYPNDGRFATEMKINDGYLYYSSERVVYRQKLNPNKLVPDTPIEVVLTDPFPLRWHNAKSIAFDKENNMYVTFSGFTNSCEDMTRGYDDPMATVLGRYPCDELEFLGAIWKFDKNKLNQKLIDGEKYSTGVRSVVGITWNNYVDNLYAVNHGRDYLYNHAPKFYSEWDNAILPSDEFMKISKGDNFGWPYTYYDHFKSKRLLAPEYGGDGKKLPSAKYKDPIYGLPAHWAPNDLLFYSGDMFPERYKNGAFIAFHGSTNRSPYPQAGYVVGFIPFKDEYPSGELEIFADGFAQVDIIKDVKDAKYRPMGLAEGPDGSLYISDSKKGKIWRVFYTSSREDFAEINLKQMKLRKYLPHIKTPVEIEDIVK
jgi:glucose/arabinose dehydrogenase